MIKLSKAAQATYFTALEGVAKALPEQDVVNSVLIGRIFDLERKMNKSAVRHAFGFGMLASVTVFTGWSYGEINALKEEIRKLKEAQKES